MACVSGLKWAVGMWSYVYAQRGGQKSYYPWPTRWGKDVEFYLMRSEYTEQSLPRQWQCHSFYEVSSCYSVGNGLEVVGTQAMTATSLQVVEKWIDSYTLWGWMNKCFR